MFPTNKVLSSQEIKELNLVIGASEEQYQTNGVDLTVGGIYHVLDLPFGTKPKDSDYQKIPMILEDEYVEPYWIIPVGVPVLIEIGETINLKGDVFSDTDTTKINVPEMVVKTPVLGYAVGRSSMLRIGVVVHGAYWDWNYRGKGKLLVIPMAQDLLIKKGDRFAQIAFWPACSTDGKEYNGTYQDEGIKRNE
jgi:deoxycytidine triphosphate deaminase